MVMSCLKVYLSSNIFLVCQFKNLLLGRSSPLPLDPISNAPVEFPTLQQNICSRTPSPISSRFHSSSLSNPPPFTYLFYPSPQIQQSCLANRQSTPAWKVGRLTANLPSPSVLPPDPIPQSCSETSGVTSLFTLRPYYKETK